MDVQRSQEPYDRQTRLADAALEFLSRHPEYQGEKLIVFLDGEQRSAIGIAGYEDDLDAVIHLFLHLRAMFAAQGLNLQIHRVGRG